MILNNLQAWLEWLNTLHPKAIEMGLERIKIVADRLQLKNIAKKIITVTGTNGKGSCVAFLESSLLASGYRVAAYTSPHLFSYNERLRIQGIEATDEQWCAAFKRVNQARENISLTYFEFGTLAAFLIIQQSQIDIAILEVGLGGRLDAVNIMDADIAIITTIALDHMEYLGPDRESIGFEKAGIFRANQPAICGDFDVPQSVIQHAQSIQAPLYCQGKQFNYEENKEGFVWRNENEKVKHLPLPNFELQNISTALQALELLALEWRVTDDTLKKVLQTVSLPGRYQLFPGKIERIFDVAHNPAAAQCFAKRLQKNKITGKTRAVVGMLADKDRENTLAPFNEIVNAWYLADLQVVRGGKGSELQKYLHSSQNETFSSVDLAYQQAIADSLPGDRVIVFGSFYTVALAQNCQPYLE